MRSGWPCLALIALAGCDQHSGNRAPPPPTLFLEASSAAGLEFLHFADTSEEFRLPEIMGSGAALLDIDGDGDLDALLLQGSRLSAVPGTRGGSAGGHSSRLFENRLRPSGQLRFEDVTERSGLVFEGYAMGVAVGDYDGDLDPDAYITALGPNALFQNLGEGQFQRVEGPQDERWSASASFLDYDLDGDLDLFFTNYVDFTPTNNKSCFSPGGARDYCNPTVYNSLPDRLFRNDWGRFSDVSLEAGLGSAFGNGLGVTSADLNADGLPDLYVANDGTENQLWINALGGRFENRAMVSGAAVNADGRAEAGMGVAAADFDGDGDDDLLLTHNTLETNTLYLNNGKGLFLDATNRHGLGIASLPFTGFGLSWNDFNHDGALDAFIANGAVTLQQASPGAASRFVQADQYFRGAGGQFELVPSGQAWGDLEPLAGRGLATGDVDLDGDLDVLVTNNAGPARLYLNQQGGRSSVRIQLRSDKPNTHALGARVALHFADNSSAWRRIHRDGSYLSSGEAVAHFGLPAGKQVARVEVRWPDGGSETYPAPAAGTVVTLHRGEGRAGSP